MNPEAIKTTVQSVIDGFTPLALQMKIPLEKLFEWAIRENYVSAINGIVGGIILGMCIYYFIKFVKWGFGCETEGLSNRFHYNDFLGFIGIMIGCLLGSILIVFLFLVIPEIIARLINPEYHALLDLIKHAGELVK